MNNESPSDNFIIFRAIGKQPEGPGAERNEDPGYYRQRELAERGAAKRSQSITARRVHQQLAQLYARLGGRQARSE